VSAEVKIKIFNTGDTEVHGIKLYSLFLYSTLVRAGDAHVFTILGYGAACYLDALRLQDAG
jgi:hypothetical protein